MRIRFEPSKYETDAQPGDRVVDITDKHILASVPYSCRSANCGTCRAYIIEGADAFAPPADDELEILEIFGEDPDRVRLCCQLRIDREVPQIVLRVVDPEMAG